MVIAATYHASSYTTSCKGVGDGRRGNRRIDRSRVRKILNVRLFESDNKRWDKSVKDEGLEVLCVSQFTLYGFLKGNKLDFHNSMNPQDASLFYGRFMDKLRSSYLPENIQDGRFAAMMNVAIVNDGPVTINIDSRNRE
ncbi:hypothetical protein Q1695_002248 [Nippostrongylus brasiliensis]|nr:hypothetical protein Q1695_002248 [Nippostrongylus brasiliensis]